MYACIGRNTSTGIAIRSAIVLPLDAREAIPAEFTRATACDTAGLRLLTRT
jgi:hypothetical protein